MAAGNTSGRNMHRMRRKKGIKMKKLLIILLALLLTGCTEELKEGIIYEKEFLPEETEIIWTTNIHYNGKTSYTTLTPIINHYPDRWCIRIHSLNQNEDGKYIYDEYFVNEEVYKECEIGELFTFEEERDSRQEPVTREKEN